MTAQVLFFDVFFKKEPHLNAVENMKILKIIKIILQPLKQFPSE